MSAKPSVRILITGASGFLGWELGRRAVAATRAEPSRDAGPVRPPQQFAWDAAGVVHAHPRTPPGVAARRADLTDPLQVAGVLEAVRPHVVIHAAAEARTDRCEQEPDRSWEVNVAAAQHLAEQCAARGARLVFTSTDMVFDGQAAPYATDAPPAPINVYGRHKAAAEQAVLQASPDFAVCRLPLMFGQGPPDSFNFLTRMLETLRQGEAVTLFEDEYRTPISNRAAADALLLFAGNPELTGVWHLGGRERVSRWELGRRAAAVCGAPLDLVRACRQADVRTSAPRPKDLSLDSSRTHAFWNPPRTIEEQLA